ncbi:MAG: serine hydrolase domain-containing protein [Rhodoglobus sp.]|nr:serine hydrolase domain-containing protein [Rhodoglobus sp.]
MGRSRQVANTLLLGVLVALLAGCAPTVPDSRMLAHTPAETSLARIAIAEQRQLSDQVVIDLVPADQPGCSAAVAIEGTVAWAGAAGLADLSAGTPVTTATRFDIASISKQFTATAVLMLQREGLLSVSDPIGAHVDNLPGWGATVTLDQLIHHTSRIPDYWVELGEVGIGFSDPADQQVTLEAIRRERSLESGSGFSYSNSNYVLLAEVVGSVSGQPLPAFLVERIFAPLALDMTLAPTLHAPDIALSYDDDLLLQEAGWTSYGHTGIITTPSQLARWGDQYRDGDIIQDDFAVGAVDEEDGDWYAAGINVQPDGDLAHTGRMGGFVSDFTVSADRKTTIAVMCNGHLSNRFGIADALWAIWDPKTS